LRRISDVEAVNAEVTVVVEREAAHDDAGVAEVGGAELEVVVGGEPVKRPAESRLP
jgi:hypothetical protein